MDLWFSSSVYVEGDIEIRVYNDSISGEVKNIPEICVRRDGMSTSNTPPLHSPAHGCYHYHYRVQRGLGLFLLVSSCLL
jgi:hypothetical protein